MDAQVPGFGVRVTDKGYKSFILRTRYPGSSTPARREISGCADITLADAREKARKWRSWVAQGIDPGAEEERQRQEMLRNQAITFAVVADDFIRQKLITERTGKAVERDIRRDLLPEWSKRPIGSITDMDVLILIRRKVPSGKYAARNLFALVKRFFRWAIAQRTYGLIVSPCEGLQVSAILGEMKRLRDRTLSEDEIFAYWRGATRMPYPYGPVYRGLILTALRLNELAGASRSEFNYRDRVWVIPPERMKGRNAGKKQARAHAVPFTDDFIALLELLPRLNAGPHLFSTTNGESPVWMGSKMKKRLDRRMLLTLRALARVRGEDDPHAVKLRPFVVHDVRRTVRSQLSRLKVAEEVREAILAHVRPGIVGVYDHHDYLDEKKEALELWVARLREIVNRPVRPRDNVVALRAMA
jgi:integrase